VPGTVHLDVVVEGTDFGKPNWGECRVVPAYYAWRNSYTERQQDTDICSCAAVFTFASGQILAGELDQQVPAMMSHFCRVTYGRCSRS
jgi:hypothetical protein